MRCKKCDDGRPQPDVSIIVINWNTDKLLEQCLTSIVENTKDISYEMMIIDNNSAGTGFKRVKQRFSEHTNFNWIENSENIGGIANNRVMPDCGGRYLLLMGPDTVVHPQCLDKMVDFLDNEKEAGAVTAKLLNPDGTPQNYYFKFWNLPMVFFSTGIGQLIDKIFLKGRFKRYYFGGDIDPNMINVVEQPAGVCFMLRWDSLAADYITDESIPFYCGDVDLCKRIYQSGYKIFLLPSAEVIHYTSSSFKQTDKKWRVREQRASSIKYFKKHHKRKVIFLKLIIVLDVATTYVYTKCLPNWIRKRLDSAGS